MWNNANINPLGGGKIVISQVTLNAATGVWSVTTPVLNTTGLDVGRLNAQGFDSNTSEDILKDVHLDTVYTRMEKAPFTEGILMERSKTIQDFLEFLTVGKFYLQYEYEDIVNGKWQERLSIGQVTAQNNNSFGQGGATTMKYRFNKITLEIDTTISAQNLTDIETAYLFTCHMAGPVVIPAGRYHTLTETTVT